MCVYVINKIKKFLSKRKKLYQSRASSNKDVLDLKKTFPKNQDNEKNKYKSVSKKRKKF